MLPPYFYSNSCLQKLTLTACIIKTNGVVNWKSLQSLCVGQTVLFNDTINDVLSGCPSLELFNLTYCAGFNLIDMTNNRYLKKLSIDYCIGDDATLQIFAPNLHSLVLSHGINWVECKVFRGESLIDCCLDFYSDLCSYFYVDDDAELRKPEPITMLTSIFDGLPCVEIVTIGEWNQWILQVLCLIELNGLLCPISKTVKCLNLRATLAAMPGIACLRKGLNCLEKLVINKWKYDEQYLEWFRGQALLQQGQKSYWLSEKMNERFDLKLKTVEIQGLEADQDLQSDQSEVLLLVQFLLKNARFMENMTIGAYGSKEYLQELSEKLQSVSRSSNVFIEVLKLK